MDTKSNRTPQTAAAPVETHQEMSHDTKTIITVLLLIFVYPVGLIIMWMWMHNWPKWVRTLISLPVLLIVLGIIAAIVLAVMNPYAKIQKTIPYNNSSYFKPTSTPIPTVIPTSTPIPATLIPATPTVATPVFNDQKYLSDCNLNGKNAAFCACTLQYFHSHLTAQQMLIINYQQEVEATKACNSQYVP